MQQSDKPATINAAYCLYITMPDTQEAIDAMSKIDAKTKTEVKIEMDGAEVSMTFKEFKFLLGLTPFKH